MRHVRECADYEFCSFWSKDLNRLVKALKGECAKDFTAQHDLALEFINAQLFHGKGEFDSRRRAKGSVHPDLKIPSVKSEKAREFLEFKLHTSQLRFLREELNKLPEIFERNDYLYFSYFMRRRPRDKSIILKANVCIYYLILLILPKGVEAIEMDELVNNIKRDAKEFVKEVAVKSGVDLEKEELIGVENILKVEDVERELEEKERTHKKELEEKDALIKETKKQLKEKDEIIKKLREENKRLKEKLK